MLKTGARIDWWQRYLEFCDRESAQSTLWFLIPLTTLTCVFMPVSIGLVYYFAGAESFYLSFVAFSILVFFLNVLLNIAETGTRTTISAYLLSVLLHIAAPVAAAFI